MATALSFDILARDRASATLTRVGKSAETTGRRFDKFRAIAAGAGIAAGAALIKFGKDSVKAYSEAQQSQTQLEDAFKRFPKLAHTNIDSFRALDTALAQKTRFDDDAYASGQAILAQFRLTGDEIKNVTPLLGDYAAKTGRDIPTAAKLLGKASLGNTRALKELGINFKATGDQGKDMATVVALLQQRVGGFAEKEGKTAAGQAAILSNQFGELQEQVGSKLVPVLTTLAEVGIKVLAFFQKYSSIIAPLAAGIAAVAVATKVWAVAQGVLNAVMAANPIGLVIIAIAGLTAGLVVAYKKSETFRKIVDAAFKGVANAALTLAKIWLNVGKFIVTTWLGVVGAIVHGAAVAFGWIPGLGGKLKTADKKFREFRQAVSHQFDLAIAKVTEFQNKINGMHGKTVTLTVVHNEVFQGGRGGGRALLGRQHGGPVDPNRAYLVGEGGRPEILYQGRVWPGGRTPPELMTPASGGGITIAGPVNFYGVSDVNEMVKQLQQYAKHNGGIKIRTFS